MSNNINYQRVRRIKNVIYAVIALLFLVPAILLIVLGVQMIRYLGPIKAIIAQNETSQAGAPNPGHGSQDGGVSDPDGLQMQFPVPQASGRQGEPPASADVLRPESSAQPEQGGAAPAESGSEASTPGNDDSTAGGTHTPPMGTGDPSAAAQPPYGDQEIPNTGLPR